MFTHVLVPLDGSQEAERALPVAVRIARATAGALTLVRVVRALAEFELGVTPPATWAPAADPLERKAAMAYLVEVRTRDLLAGVTTNASVYAGRAATMILTAASDRHVDLIVLTGGGRGGITRWMLGSVAEEVAREAKIPVLVLRTGSHRGDEVRVV